MPHVVGFVMRWKRVSAMLKKILHDERQAAIKARYQSNADHVFKDVKLTGPQSVETLLDTEEVEVAEVDAEDSVILTTQCTFNPDLPVYGGMKPLRITMVDTDQIWFTTPHGLLPGMKISQRTPVGSEQEVFQRFATEWMQRWNRHQNMSPERWHHINRFSAATFPTRSFQLPAIDDEMWEDAVQAKPKRSAAGLDGVQRDDLHMLSPQGKADMIQFIDQCETEGEWPCAMCHGAVHSLQKVADATHASQFRPITILSLCYRVWSSIRGRQIMDQLTPYLPSGLMGNVAGRSSVAMWYRLQAMVEDHQLSGDSLSGASVDIVKCFNTLPRQPLLLAALRLGVPEQVLKPWAYMLGNLARHFVVQSSWAWSPVGDRVC